MAAFVLEVLRITAIWSGIESLLGGNHALCLASPSGIVDGLARLSGSAIVSPIAIGNDEGFASGSVDRFESANGGLWSGIEIASGSANRPP